MTKCSGSGWVWACVSCCGPVSLNFTDILGFDFEKSMWTLSFRCNFNQAPLVGWGQSCTIFRRTFGPVLHTEPILLRHIFSRSTTKIAAQNHISPTHVVPISCCKYRAANFFTNQLQLQLHQSHKHFSIVEPLANRFAVCVLLLQHFINRSLYFQGMVQISRWLRICCNLHLGRCFADCSG